MTDVGYSYSVQVLAQRGETRLVTYGELGCVVDMVRETVWPPMRYEAILGRGYWEPFEGDPGPVLKLAEGAFDTVMAAGYDESKHPRDPGGEGGGQWIPKGAVGADAPKLSDAQRRSLEALPEDGSWLSYTEWRALLKAQGMTVSPGTRRSLENQGLIETEIRDVSEDRTDMFLRRVGQLTAAGGHDESKHPRVPAGTANRKRDVREGGQFAPRGASAPDAPAEVEEAPPPDAAVLALTDRMNADSAAAGTTPESRRAWFEATAKRIAAHLEGDADFLALDDNAVLVEVGDESDRFYRLNGTPAEQKVQGLLLGHAGSPTTQQATAIRQAIAEEFDLPIPPKLQGDIDHWRKNPHYTEFGSLYGHPGMRSFVRAVYSDTQLSLAEMGIGEFDVWRGDTSPRPAGLWPGSSVTLSRDIADDYAKGMSNAYGRPSEGGVVRRARTPASNVWSLPWTGPGEPESLEVILVGEPEQAFVRGAALTAAFDESKVKRVAKGTANKKRDPKEGGQFTEKDAAAGGTGTDDEKAAEEFAAKLVEFEAAREPVSAERAAEIEALKKADPSAAVTVIGSTQLDFFDFETGQWDEDRRNAHHVKWEIEALVEGQPSENPTALFMAGGSGTGKSTLKDDLHLDPDHAVQVNPDVQKEFHPEYIAMNEAAKAAGLPGDPLAAPYVHEESSHVAKQIAREAILMRSNMTIDGTGDSGVPGHFLKKIDAAREAGYAVEVVVVDTPVDIAMARAEARFRSKGRAVDANDLKNIHKNVAVQFEDWHTKVDDWRVYANDGKRGEQELIAYREKGGDVIVLNEARFNQFRKKGKG